MSGTTSTARAAAASQRKPSNGQEVTTRQLPGNWRQEVRGRAARIRESADALALSSGVEQHLVAAEAIAGARSGLLEWWSGANIEAAWLHLRLAEEKMILSVTGDRVHVEPIADQALQHAHAYLPTDHALAVAVKEDMQSQGADWELIRRDAYNLTVRAHEVSDDRHQLMRSFRNQMLGLVAFLVVLAAGGLILVSLLPVDVAQGLLPAPAGLSPLGGVVLAGVMGAVGALFSAVPSLAQAPTVEAVFNPIRIQAVLKVVVGAWSGVVGLMVVAAGMSGAEVAGQPAQAGGLAGFAVMAALFGASQEAITRFADHRAGETASSTK